MSSVTHPAQASPTRQPGNDAHCAPDSDRETPNPHIDANQLELFPLDLLAPSGEERFGG